MTKVEVHIEIVDDSAPLRVVEVLESVHIERANLIEMVEAGVVAPVGHTLNRGVEQWQFLRRDLRRLRTARRLVSDLNINLAGAALVIDLIEERDALLRRLQSLRGLVEDL